MRSIGPWFCGKIAGLEQNGWGRPVGGESSAVRIQAAEALNGPLPLPALEAQRSAGPRIRRELEEAEQLRRDLLGARTDPRRFPPDVAARLLCAWNAYVLQTVGEHLLDAVRYRTFGSVRAEVAGRILEFLGPAGRWLYQARCAAADRSYRLVDNVDLPAEPPSWPDRKYRTYPLSAAMATAAQEIHATGDAVLGDLIRSTALRDEDAVELRELLDTAGGAVEYAMGPENALGVAVSAAIHLWHALRSLFLFGQAAAMPALLDIQDRLKAVSLVSGVPSSADPWCLTDPRQRAGLRSLPSARTAVERLWADDPAAAVTARVQAEIDAALRSGATVFAADENGEPLGSFHRCPWPAIYEVRRPVTIGGVRLMPMRQFTFDVLGEARGRGGPPYTRAVVASVFVPAGDVALPGADDRTVRGGRSASRHRRGAG